MTLWTCARWWLTKARRSAARRGVTRRARLGVRELEDRLVPSGVPLRDLSIVAHEDDSLVFMNPDLQRSIAAGNYVETIVMTAGDAGLGVDYANSREQGTLAGYAQLAGVPDQWQETNVFGTHTYTLDGTKVSVVFLRLHASLMENGVLIAPLIMNIGSLWHYGENPGVVISTVDEVRTYSKQQLIDTLGGLINDFHPDIVRTLDGSGNAGPSYTLGDPSRNITNFVEPYFDHSEHYYSAIFADAALQEYDAPYELFEYRGYNIATDVANVSPADLSLKVDAFTAYADYDSQVGGILDDPAYGNWLRRQYLVEQGIATATALTVSLAPAFGGQTATLTATVTDAYGDPVTDGSVGFLDGGNVLATSVSLNADGQAILTRFLPAGQHSLRVVYNGMRNFNPSADPSFAGSSDPNNVTYPTVFPYLTVIDRTSATNMGLTVLAPPSLSAGAGPAVVLGTGGRLTVSSTLDNGVNATGALAFTLYGPGGTVVDSETAPVNGDGRYAPPQGYLPDVAGTYQWVVSYSGDGNNESASTPVGSVAELAVGPGVTVVGDALYLVGGSTNDTVAVKPAGVSKTGATGVRVTATLAGRKLGTVAYAQAFAAIDVTGFGGNDTVSVAPLITIPVLVSEGDGKDVISLGAGDNTVTVGSGKATIAAGNGNNTVVAAGGTNRVKLGRGDNVVALGAGTNSVSVGDGDNLIAGGTGASSIRAGSGSNILVDGDVRLTRAGDTLRQVLSDWVQYGAAAANVADIRSRLGVTYNTAHANTLKTGLGLDWFWNTDPSDHTNRKPTDLLN
jgi:hypothetical protein